MGVVDKKARELLSDPEEFSKLVNMAVFGGKPVVRPENLREMDSVVALADEDMEQGRKGRKGKGSMSNRDLLRRTLVMEDGQRRYMLLGVENQAFVDYGMPLRMAHYDIELYMRQMRETGRRRRRKGEKQRRVNGRKQPFTSDFGPGDKVTLVVSMVVYYGDEPWDAPTELAELYPEIPEEIAEYVKPLLPSYKMKIVSPQNQDAELDMLGPGLRAVLYYARHAHDAAGLQRMLEEHPELRTPVPLAASLISSLMRRKQIVKNKEENVNMWTVLEDAKRIGRDEGRAEGRVEGRAEGRAEGEAEVVCSMYRNGMKISEISKYTNISIARLRRMVARQKI